MRTLGRVVAVALLVRGAVLVASPHGYLRCLSQECMPRWIRSLAEPWLKLPVPHLRLTGLTLLLVAALLFGLAEEAEGQGESAPAGG